MDNPIKTAAYDLFLAGYEKENIAKIFDKALRTVQEWAQEANWDAKRNKRNNSIAQIEERLLKMIEYQTLTTDKYIEEQTNNQEFSPLKSGMIDALNKLLAAFKAIATRESKQNYIYIAIKYAKWLQQQGFENTDDLIKTFDLFLQEQLQSLKK